MFFSFVVINYTPWLTVGMFLTVSDGHLLLQQWTPGMDVRRRNAVVNCPTGATMLNIVENGKSHVNIKNQTPPRSRGVRIV